MLYNDFRPKVFQDIIGQDTISTVLKNQIKTESFSHAYLFCGTRGTGKTTSAKVLAKAVNCLSPKNGEPCGECEMCKKISNNNCVDVIEMDAASKRKIDDMRNLIDALKYPPAEAKYRVYIIDEVHMLTTEAVNAFLKTLEEPPSNVIFILATTDPQKLPVTILSRCQKFSFRRIKVNDIFKRLQFVCNQIGLSIDDDGLNLIAKVADGAMRDALSILEQAKSLTLSSNNSITYKQILSLLGSSSNNDMFEICKHIFTKDVLKALEIINTLDNNGKDFILFTKDLIKFMRNLLMAKVMGVNSKSVIPMGDEDIENLIKLSSNTTKEDIISCINLMQEAEFTMMNSSQIRVILELAIIKSINFNKVNTTSKTQSNSKSPDEIPDKNKKENFEQKEKENEKESVVTKVKKSKAEVIKALKASTTCRRLGEALEKSNMKLTSNFKIKIETNIEKDKQLIATNKDIIKRGFITYLKTDNIELIVL